MVNCRLLHTVTNLHKKQKTLIYYQVMKNLTHRRHFIRSNLVLNAPIAEGHKSTLLPQLGNISYRLGRALNCNPLNGHILDDKEAMNLWNREYEKSWGPVV